MCHAVWIGSDVTGWDVFDCVLLCQQWGGEWLGMRAGEEKVTKKAIKAEAQAGRPVGPPLP